MFEASFKFEKFVEYTPILLSNINKVVEVYLHNLRALNTPILQQLNKLGEEQLKALLKERLCIFLQNVLGGNPFSDVKELIHNWKRDKLHGNISKHALKPQDIILAYLARKRAFVTFLPEFVEDPRVQFSIWTELDQYNSCVESMLFDTYIKIQQEQLFLSEERSRALVEASFEGISIHDKVKILDANEEMLRCFGYSYDEMVGMEVSLLVAPEARNKALEHIDLGYGHAYESIGLRKDGSTFPILVLGKDIKFKGRKLRVTAVRDLTYIKTVEQQLMDKNKVLEDKERNLSNVLDNIKDVFFQTDAAGNWINLNKSWKEITGFEIDDTLGKPLLDYVHKDDQEGNLKLFMDLIHRKKEYCRHVVRYRTISGEYKWIDVHARLTLDENNNILGTTGTLRDISEQKKAELEIQDAYSMLKKAEESLRSINNGLEERVALRTQELESKNIELNSINTKLTKINADLDNFIYTASHDLKAPILNLEGLLNALKGKVDVDNSQVSNLLRMMNHSVDRFKKTIKDLTEISKIQKNLDEEDKEKIYFDEMLTNVLSDIEELIEASNAEIITDFRQAPHVYFSRKNMRSILYNLLSNSIKYKSHNRKPVVEVKTALDESNALVLSVKDNGLGLKLNQVDQVFTMFKRMHTHVDGSGVGLYIVKKMVENEGGKIEVDSQEGVGTEFKLILPNCLAATETAPHQQ